jgi:oligopeptide transport system permease protein
MGLFPWLVTFPAVILATVLFSLNFLGDGLRDALDPKLKNSDQ